MAKKFIASVLVVFAAVFCGLVSAGPVNAEATSNSVKASAPVLVAEKVSSSTALAPKHIGGGVIKPMWLYVSCYTAMNGERWCWRYGCTWFETVALGCHDGWYRTYSPWYS